MLQITITETDTKDEITNNADAILLIEQAEEILDKLLSLGIFEHDQTVENRLTEISTLLFTAQCSLSGDFELAELHN